MRKIDTRLIAPVARPETIGPAPDLRWIDIAALRVDPAYQRDLGRRNVEHIRKIAAAFDWRLFSVVVVSPVQGGYSRSSTGSTARRPRPCAASRACPVR